MGSAFPKVRSDTCARSLLAALARIADQTTGSQEPQIALGADLIDDALSDPLTRRQVTLALSSFILEALSGLIPDPRPK